MDKEKFIRFLTLPLVIFLDILGIVVAAYLIKLSNNFSTLVIAFIFLLLTIVASFFNTLGAFSYYDSYNYEREFKKIKLSNKKLKRYPKVAIVMPSYNEDPKMVKKNLLRLKKVDYPKNRLKIYLLDDSSNKDIVDELSRFAKENNIVYIHRENREGFKAGALNNMLRYSKEEFIAIFDADEYLSNLKFLKELLPLFDDKSVAYVQTEKRYKNTKDIFSQSINLFNMFFFSFIEPSRASRNTSIFAGSCGIIRKEVLDKIGGFPTELVEDTFFSFKARINGFKGIYVPKAYAYGEPIRTFMGFARQQWRYNYGDTKFLKHYILNFKKIKKFIDYVDYFSLGFGINYLSVILLLFSLLSIFIVFSPFPFEKIPLPFIFNPQYMKPELELYGIIALFVSFLAPIIVSRIYFKSFRYGIMVYLLNFSLAIIRTEAAIAALFNLNPRKGWVKDQSNNKVHRFVSAVRNARKEIAFSLLLFILSILAISNDNIEGFSWLFIFAIFYSTTFFFFYKYG